MRTDRSLSLPPVDAIKTMDDLKDYLRKMAALLDNNQGDVQSDLNGMVDRANSQTVTGTKTFNALKLGGDMDAQNHQIKNLVIETLDEDPADPEDYRIWAVPPEE